MRVGVTVDNNIALGSTVCAHFGQCKYFLIADIDQGSISNVRVVPNTAQHGGGGCVAVSEIMKHNVTHVISGGMGMGAQQKFQAAGVKIFGFSGGTAEEAIHHLLKESLGGLAACREHGDCH